MFNDADQGMSPELELDMARVDRIVDAVCGTEYRDLIRRTDCGAEDSAPLYSRAFELFQAGCLRAKQLPEQYEYLITWKHEKTIHGVGHPGLQEALNEEYINTWYGNEWRADIR